MVHYRLHLAVERRSIDLILMRHFRQQQLRIVQNWIAHGMDQLLHQESDYRRARQFQIHHVGGLVDLVPRQSVASPVAFAFPLRDMLHETPLEVTGEYRLLIVGERACAGIHKHPYHARPQITDLLVGVIHTLHIVHDTAPALRLEKRQQQFGHFAGGEKPEFMGVLEIHHLIAYIIGSLHKIHKRMTRIAQRSVGRRTSKHSQLVGHAAEVGKKLKKALSKSLNGFSGVLEIRGKGLMLGIVLDRDAHDILEPALKAGLTFSVTAGNVIRLVPPLILTEAEADEIVKRITPVIRAFLALPKI